MGKFYDHIPANIVSWIQDQKIFYVATAPLLEDGHVNMSPKGCSDTFHVVYDEDDDTFGVKDEVPSDPADEEDAGKKVAKKSRAVWYEDMSGSGIETISHLKENGRITVMFVAFEGPPQIVRLFGTGKVYEFGTPEYEELLPLNKRQPGSRAVIWVDVYKVGTSCGFSIPFFDYNRPRNKLHRLAAFSEQKDYDHDRAATLTTEEKEKAKEKEQGGGGGASMPGLRHFWKTYNLKSLDGLPGLEVAYSTSVPFNDWKSTGKVWDVDDETIRSKSRSKEGGGATLSFVTGQGLGWDLGKVLVGFGAGLVVSSVISRFVKV
ncbi:hypothetical protein EST38_g13267 [Candolleomyces aberdarensis]|uniref:Pyridoxamine 5'-phosphate oxidase putative domain-containing protein n=1 Tax=Candolleomyces aberdarensis TaxID=2316362 RepID=A0A4Q2D297_9AGAR|nr:hypothetical protein EST38_g13267 [Candolleomyces aberdarensis]